MGAVLGTLLMISPAHADNMPDSVLTTPHEAHADMAQDPWEGWNRNIFAFNDAVDSVLIRPIAIAYQTILPGFARNAISNVLSNLGEPVSFINLALQGEADGAANSLMRFTVNSTIGIVGIFEVADEIGLHRQYEDFGQTLAVWGVEEGPYMVLPILGPSNPRDLMGRLVDGFVLDPFWHVAEAKDEEEWMLVRKLIDGIDTRARNLGTLDDLKRSSIDYYASIRSLYRQRRSYEISNGFDETEF